MEAEIRDFPLWRRLNEAYGDNTIKRSQIHDDLLRGEYSTGKYSLCAHCNNYIEPPAFSSKFKKED